MKKYQMELTEEQADIVVRALDLYTRIGIGQFDKMLEVFTGLGSGPRNPASESYINTVKEWETGQPPNGSFGIHSSVVRNEFRQAFDICQVVRHRLAHDRNPGGHSVHHYEPLKASTVAEDVMPVIKQV